MDRYVKNFIAASILYLGVASVMGVLMLVRPALSQVLSFPHSHLMVLGWVSMMIYGVGYHILPRFAGKLVKRTGLCEFQFWVANAGLIGMVVFNPLYVYHSGNSAILLVLGISGALQVLSSCIFLFNIFETLYQKEEKAGQG